MTAAVKRTDPVDVEIGERIRLMRRARKLSLEEVGKFIGVSYQQQQKYETGANRIAGPRLRKLAVLFKCSVGQIVGEEEEDVVRSTDLLRLNRRLNALDESRRGIAIVAINKFLDLAAGV